MKCVKCDSPYTQWNQMTDTVDCRTCRYSASKEEALSNPYLSEGEKEDLQAKMFMKELEGI